MSTPKQKTIDKYTKFINSIEKVLRNEISFYQLTKDCGVSNNTVTAMKNLGFLIQINPNLFKKSKTYFDLADVKKLIFEVNKLGNVYKLKKQPESVKQVSIQPQTVKDMSTQPVKVPVSLKVKSAEGITKKFLSDISDESLITELKRRGYKGSIGKRIEFYF